MDPNSQSKIKKLFVDNYYRKFLLEQKEHVKSNYPDFWDNLNEQEALEWLDSIVIDAKKLHFGNEFLIQGYIDIVCKIGKDFLLNPDIDDDLVKFITDSNFSPYVRVRDANRYIDKNFPKITQPELSDIRK